MMIYTILDWHRYNRFIFALSVPLRIFADSESVSSSKNYNRIVKKFIGKLCLQHDDVAKKCIPALGRELETSPDAPVRNNVVIALCDLFKM